MVSSHVTGPKLPDPSEGGPPIHPTLTAALKHVAATSPSDRGITFIEAGVKTFESYAELLVAARKALGALQKVGFAKGQPLVLQITERQTHFHVLWGAILGGITPVTIAIPPKYEANNAVFLKLAGVIEQLDARHVIASALNVQPLEALLPPSVAVHDAARLDMSVADSAIVEPELWPSISTCVLSRASVRCTYASCSAEPPPRSASEARVGGEGSDRAETA